MDTIGSIKKNNIGIEEKINSPTAPPPHHQHDVAR